MVSCQAHATEGDAPSLWLTNGFNSYYLSQPPVNYNTSNTGFGIQFRFSGMLKNDMISAGSYHNHMYKISNYVAYDYMPISFGNFKLGAAIGIINGLPVNNGGYAPYIVPTASFDALGFGVNILYVPALPSVPELIAIQFKTRLF